MLIPFEVMYYVCVCACVHGEGESEAEHGTAFHGAIKATVCGCPAPHLRQSHAFRNSSGSYCLFIITEGNACSLIS